MVMVMAAAALVVIALIVVMVMMVVMMVLMMVAALMLVVIIIVMVVMVAAAALVIIIVIVVVMMVMMLVLVFMLVSLEFFVSFFSQLVEFCVQSLVGLHYLEHLCSAQLIPVSRYDLCCLVELPDIVNNIIEFCGRHALLMRKEDGACVLYLVREELSEVLHVHLISLGIDYCSEAVEFYLVILEILNGNDNIRELAYARWLDKDPVRIILLDDLVECLAEVSDECAADAARDHLVDLYARLSEESCVDSDLTKLVLDQNDVLCLIAFGYKFFDQCCLACSEESGEDIYFCHFVRLSF